MYIKEMLEVCDKGMSFPTPVGEVYLSVDKCIYNLLCKKYTDVTKSAEEKFISLCTVEPENEDDLNNVQAIFDICKRDICTEMKKDIASIGIYNIRDDTMDTYASETFGWKFEAIIAALYDLLGEQRYTFSYRELSEKQVKKFNKIVGIRVEDYITGLSILKALHSSFSNISLHLAMALFQFVDMRNNPADNATALSKHVSDVLFGGEEGDKCDQLLSNINQDIIPKEQVGKLLLHIAQTDPFKKSLYTCIVKYFGDKNREIQTLADYLDYGDTITSYKEALLHDYFNNLSMETEAETFDAKEKLEAYCAHIGYDDEDKAELFQEIADRLEKLDQIYRTVDDIVFETRESADLAKEELPNIKEFMSHISAPTADSLLDYEWQLKENLTEFDIRFSSGLKPKYIKIMEKYLKDFDDLFCTVGLFKKLDRKAAGKERLLKLVKKYDVTSPDKIAEAYIQMEELLPKVGLEKGEDEAARKYLEKSKDELALKFVKENMGATEEDAKEAKTKLLSYCESLNLTVSENLMCIQYIDKVLADYDLKYRTVDQIVCETRESADFARKELEGIREFMKQISEPTFESLLDYENDLLDKRKSFEETFQSELKQKYLTQIDKYLSDFDRKFCYRGLLKTGDRKLAGKDKALKYVKKLDCSSPEKVNEAYRLLEEFLPKVGITLEEANEAVQYLEKKKGGKGLFGSVGKLFGK